MNKFYTSLRRLCCISTMAASALAMAPASAQTEKGALSLNMAIEIAKDFSSQAKVAQFSLMGQYWNYRSYKANMLPSLNLETDIMNYDRSIVEDRVGSDIVYVENNTLDNAIELSLDQNIALTGGTLSISTDVTRLDQFDNTTSPLTYKTNPLSLSYSQPLMAYNSLKWKKKTEPKKYERAKRTYLESMEAITIRTTTYFFNVLSAQSQYKRNMESYQTLKELYDVAQRRYDLGTIKYSELLQLQLSVLNAEMSINTSRIAMESSIFTLCTYIGLPDYNNISLIQPFEMPDFTLEYDSVLDKSYTNSSHTLEQDLKRLTSEQAVAQAKGTNGLQAEFSVSIGLSQNDELLKGAYQNLKDREIFGVSLSMPIFDWGVGKGEIEMAKADLDVTLTEIEEEDREFRQEIYTKVMEFNNQKRQCEIAIVAQNISKERLDITTLRFQNGTVTVTEFNNAQEDFEEAQAKYITYLKSYWTYYYEIQQMTLYDYINKRDISAEFEKLVK
ncbi:MAG: TolC family protein [Rikenellaceae bacterium]